jgi:hypothetical protein
MLGLGNKLTIYKFKGDNAIKLAITAFKTRVAADGGIFEAENCLKQQLKKI